MGLHRQETCIYRFDGDDTVNTAIQLLGKMPNGWELRSLEHIPEVDKTGYWVAVVAGPMKFVDERTMTEIPADTKVYVGLWND